MQNSKRSFIGLGSNLGDRKNYIETALDMLSENPQIEVLRTSKIIETVPLGRVIHPNFLNAVAEIETTLTAEELHKTLSRTETMLGRQRGDKWQPRTIDLDLLLFSDEIIDSPDLTVPHPQMHLRSFVLDGVCELNTEVIHTVLNVTAGELQDRLNRADFVINPELPQLVSLAGIIGVGKTTLAEKLANLLNCKILLERYADNTFLPDVYAGRKELSLDSQLFFLKSRIEQLNQNTLEQGKIVITDYIFDKELIYAAQLLNEQQMPVYEKSHRQLAVNIAQPVLVLYLNDSVPNCLRRIRKRNRPYEQKIEEQFLEGLNVAYEQLFAGWNTCPVIRILISELDYTKDSDINHLINQIKSYIAV